MDYYDELLSACNEAGRTEFIGRTVLGYEIPIIRKGKGKAHTLLVGATHAREYITADLLIGMAKAADFDVDIVPCLNIDGVRLCKYGPEAIDDEDLRSFLIRVNKSKDFSLWKANARAVDVNVNFAAEWATGKSNVFSPAPSDYVGRYPESEPETFAAAELVRKGAYAQLISFHSKGEVVYHGFGNNYRYKEEAARYAESLDYILTTAEGSAGGLKDYFDVASGGLGLTTEVGSDALTHPIGIEELDNLMKKHLKSLEIIDENGRKIARSLYGSGD